MAAVEALPPDDEEAQLAAFTVPGQAKAISEDIDANLDSEGVEDNSAQYHDAGRLVEQERCDYLLPTVVHCDSPERPMAGKEYMFPFVTVVECPQEQMIGAIGDTLVASAITEDADFRAQPAGRPEHRPD